MIRNGVWKMSERIRIAGADIGDLHLDKPVIQGGMGIGVSRSRLAGAVAAEGGIGVISAAQIGYDSPLFREKPEAANLLTLPLEIRKAKAAAGGKGAVAVNIMSVTQLYGEYVRVAAGAGADAVISGAGLPAALPKYVEGTDVKIAPVVSSEKAAELLLRMWDRKYHRTADFLIMESPYSGGHQGFTREQLSDLPHTFSRFEEEVRHTVRTKQYYELRYGKKIPLFVAGGVFTAEDTVHALELGADGIQAGTRFIPTEECDASMAYKQAFINAKEEDVVIIDSPVGMPGRAIKNPFVDRMLQGREKIDWCYNCLKICDPKTAKYCISQALINAVRGDLDNGLIFCSARVGEITRMQTVREVINELLP